jgi:hypothetical protein
LSSAMKPFGLGTSLIASLPVPYRSSISTMPEGRRLRCAASCAIRALRFRQRYLSE